MDKNKMKNSITGIALIITMLFSSTAFAQKSLYTDVKAHRVGDIITVVLMENISGSSSSDSKVASNASASASASTSGNFMPFEATFGGGSSVDYDADLKNQSTQRQLLEGFLSVQIVEVSPSGDLMVEGTRYTEINGELHEMSLQGTVRQNDVDGQNQVPSYRIANARISYKKDGGFMHHKKKRGAFKRIALGVVTAAVTAVTVMKSMGN
jgi:flagellar L-ring protein precursor FlgH